MPLITFQPLGQTIQVQPGTALLDAARQAGVDVEAPCGGKGTCGNCALRIISGRTTDESLGVLTLAEIDQGFVLACRTAIGDDDVTVEALDQTARGRGQFSDDEGLDRIDPALLPAPEDRRPLTEKICLLVAPSTKGRRPVRSGPADTRPLPFLQFFPAGDRGVYSLRTAGDSPVGRRPASGRGECDCHGCL